MNIEYRRLRAPREHGQVLIDPPLSEVDATIAHNRNIASKHYTNVPILNATLAELSSNARRGARDRVWEWPDDEPLSEITVLSGHQPELYHPGVWFKNFVLSSIAKRHSVTAINLLIDNDTVSQPAIRVPRLEYERIDNVAVDAPASELPHEERQILDGEIFSSLAERVGFDRCLLTRMAEAWKVPRLPNLGESITRARIYLEHRLGLRTHTANLSSLCDTSEFAQFALHLLISLPELRAVYNEALREFRTVHRIRSRSHPVPELQQLGERLEAPLWIWRSGAPRRALFAWREGNALAIGDRDRVEVQLPLANGRATQATVDAWLSSRRDGLKIRPRALITTMYARMVLSDLFIHGIGGAKYDQLTDAIIERFFGIPAPKFMTVTATMQLHPTPGDTADRLRAAEHALREFPYHPETYVTASDPPELQELSDRKKIWLNTTHSTSSKAWRQLLIQLNQQLADAQPHVAARLRSERNALAAQLDHEKLFGSREFSFCLFDEELPRELKRLAEHP